MKEFLEDIEAEAMDTRTRMRKEGASDLEFIKMELEVTRRIAALYRSSEKPRRSTGFATGSGAAMMIEEPEEIC